MKSLTAEAGASAKAAQQVAAARGLRVVGAVQLRIAGQADHCPCGGVRCDFRRGLDLRLLIADSEQRLAFPTRLR
ncbi:hypothetical protein AQI88_30770 [Streptomyces cellostaticus]|uniref:Uncharacterized protein n=1 Tax=Streptomyces cellostaticus TaxID=67285 RepID=A0A101NFX8_9ACTN|nr:hypothetical protein [Streptomyces cellostaticus]KUM92563.1 hypothetical protein AQI88_30770 [Streptomyces cellostaticus]